MFEPGGGMKVDKARPTAVALDDADPLRSFRARFVIGPGVADGARVARRIVGLAPHFETVEGAGDLATEYAASDAAIELWNSDGSRSEISGNGTRCAAALLIESGHVAGPDIRILTGAGVNI